MLFTLAMADPHQVGTGYASQNQVPNSGANNFSWSRSIYTQSEILAAGINPSESIVALGYHVSNQPENYTLTDQFVYIRNTTDTQLHDSDVIDLYGFSMIFDGTVTYDGDGWQYFRLNYSFPYAGEGIEIIWQNNHGQTADNMPSFSSTPMQNMAAYCLNNDRPPTQGDNVTFSSSRPNIMFVTPMTTLPEPAKIKNPYDEDIIMGEARTLQWTAGEGIPNGYKLYFGTSNPPEFVAELGNVTSYNLEDLEIENTYYWKVEPHNEAGTQTSVPVWSFEYNPYGHTQIGTDTSLSGYPFLTGYRYTVSAALYNFDEINEIGMLTRVGWYCEQPYDRNMSYKIYVGATGFEEVPYVPYDVIITDLTLAAEGEYNFTEPGWHMFELNDPIPYVNGNLMVVVDIHHNTWPSSSPEFRYTQTSNYSHAYWMGTHAPQTGNPSSTNGRNRPNLMLHLTDFTGDPQLQINTATINFGEVYFGATADPRNATITNMGGGPLTIELDDVSLSGSDQFSFDENSFPIALNPTERASFPVYFTGTTEGAAEATITINCLGVEHQVNLRGNVLSEGLVVMGNGQVNKQLPINPGEAYSYSQTLFKADELDTINRQLEKLAYHWNGSGMGSNSNEWTIYLGHTDKSAFISDSDWLPQEELTQVYQGNVAITPTNQWIEIELDTPYIYDGINNLVVAIQETKPGNDSVWGYFYASNSSYASSLRCDGADNIDLASLPDGTLQNAYPNTRLYFGDLVAVMAVSPKNIEFDAIYLGETGEAKYINITNEGEGILHMVENYITITGANPASFAIDSSVFPLALSKNETAQIPVYMIGNIGGNVEATLKITLGEIVEEVALSGEILLPDKLISGTFSTVSWDLEDILITATGIDAENIVYDAVSGEYEITVPYDFSGTITPTKAGYIIEPESRQYSNVIEDIDNHDYVIKKDVDPTVAITYPQNDHVFNFYVPTAVTITWEATDYAVEFYEIKFGTGDWESIGQETEFTTDELETGDYYFAVRGVQNTPQAKGEIGNTWIENTASEHENKGTGAIAEVNFSVVIPEYVAGSGDVVFVSPGIAMKIDGTGTDFIGAIDRTADVALTPIPNPNFVANLHNVWELIGTGSVNITINSSEQWFAYMVAGEWVPIEGPLSARTITYDLDAKNAFFEFAFGAGDDPTLPVELNYFAIDYLTRDNSVRIRWQTASETQMLGYHIYRSTEDNLASARVITPTMIVASNSSTGESYTYLDTEVENGTYYYWLEAISYSSSEFYGYKSVIVDAPLAPELPEISYMSNAYPNPFRGSTNIDIAIKEGETGSFTIYNMLGQAVYSQKLNEGNINIKWHGKDNNGKSCGNGVYFYKLTTPTKSETKKMVIMK